MIYAGELGIQYPVKDLYDKTLMQMSIAAAKDMYEKGQKRLEDFNAKYGDFMSPIAKDMEWYDKNVIQMGDYNICDGLGAISSSGCGDGNYPVFAEYEGDSAFAIRIKFL